MIGTRNNQKLISNLPEIASRITWVSAISTFPPFTKPRIRKITNAIEIDGMVVYAIYLMCVNRSVPAIAGARFVVSESGDILSPKYAPDMIAPATIPAGIFNTVPIATKAIPTVAEVVHEEPVATETIAQTIQAATRKIAGFKICKP